MIFSKTVLSFVNETHKMRPQWGGITMCFWSSRYCLCMGSHYWIRGRSRRNYVWL